MKSQVLLVLIFIALPFLCGAQDDVDQKRVGVVMLSKHNQQKVWLRWAPTSAVAWELGNANGWWVQKVLVPTTTEPGDTSYTLLSKTPFKPLPLEHWETPSDTSDYAATAAQVLYGETLNVTSTSGAMTLIDKNRELETRFSFGLSAAELDFNVAQMMGLGITDNNVLPNRTYIYRVFANISDSLVVVDTAGVVVNLNQKYELPKVFDLAAEVHDTLISLQWPAGYHKGIYSTYSIEKRIGNGTFTPVNSLPLANMFSKGGDDFLHFFTDIHRIEGDTLYYRIRGITPFADYGSPSEPVMAIVPLLYPLPANLKYSEVDGEQIAIAWEYPLEFENKLSSFELLAAIGFKDKPFSLGKYPINSRAAAITVPTPEFYLSVAAIGTDGSKRLSHPMMIQLADSIPPAAPKGLAGSVSKLGIASISWQRGTEPDLFGYKVYTHSNPDAEFNMETKSFVRDTSYQFRVNLNTLSANLYLKVMAYDYRYNYSGFSQMLKLALPDTIPPSAPVLKTCAKTIEGVMFEWIPSGSNDVASHAIVYALNENDTPDTLTVISNISQKQYVWETPTEGNYWFWVVATDTSGNATRSQQNHRLKTSAGSIANFSPKLAASKSIAEGTISLQWTKHPATHRVLVYLNVGNSTLRLHKTLLNTNSFTYTNAAIAQTYKFVVVVQDSTGRLSEYSNEVEVKF